MKYPTELEIKKQTNDICNLILANDKDIEFKCNAGSILINPINLNFTYIGEWGNMVLNSAITKRINNKKLLEDFNIYNYNNNKQYKLTF